MAQADIQERFEISSAIFPVGDESSGLLSYFRYIKLCITTVVLCHGDNIVESCLGKLMTFCFFHLILNKILN